MEGDDSQPPTDDAPDVYDGFVGVDLSPDRHGEPDLQNFPTLEEFEALEDRIARLVQNAVEELPDGDEPAWKVVNHLSYAGEEVRRARRARRIGKEDGVV